MSSVELLRIQGIRSFGPDRNDEAIIKFSTPLTLILGQNGCGKTTIIEALKYAISGELPAGTDSGSGFVHDPKLANQLEVKGNVKLKCRDVKGGVITVSRTVRVLQKLKKLEFKSVDSSFTKGEGKDKQESVSGKCADIDGTMCEALGTSQAVLTHVIFCHQEDSLWPLEKGKKIKERFDAIFGISEYNKCLDYFRATSKDLLEKKKIIQKDVEYNGQFWEEAKAKFRKLDDLKGSAAAHRDEVERIQVELGPINEQIDEIMYKESNYAQHKAEMTGKEDRKKLIMETIDELKKEIREEFSGSKDELLNEIRNFEEKLKETIEKLDDFTSERTNLVAEESRIQKEINSKSMLMGQLQRDEEEHKKNIDARNKSLRNLGNELEVSVISNSQLTPSSSEDAIREIENKIKMRHTEKRSLEEEHSRFENQIQSKINAAIEKKATLTNEVKMKRITIESNQRELERVKAEIAEVDKSGDKLAKLEKNLKEVNEQLDGVIASLDADQCKAEIEKANEDLKTLEKKVASLDKEIRQLHDIKAQRASLNNLIERQTVLENELNALEGKHRATLQHLLTSIPEGDIKTKLQTRYNELNKEIRTHEDAINQLERKLSVLKEQKRSAEEQIKQKKKKMSQDEDHINENLGEAKDIDTYYKDLLKKISEANGKKGTVEASRHFFKKYLEKLQSEDRVCPLCHREFGDESECQEIVEDLQVKIEKIPQQLISTENLLKTLTEEQTKAARLLPLYEGIQNIKAKELPKLKSDLEKIEREMKNVENELKSHRDSLDGPQTDREMTSKVLLDAGLMDQRKKEIQALKRDIKNQEDKLPSVASGKTLEQANTERDQLQSDIEDLRKEFSNKQRNLSSYNDRVNKLREKKTELTAEQLKIAGGVQKRKTLVENQDKLNATQTKLQKELEQAQAQLQPIEEEMEREKGTLFSMRSKHKLLLEERRKEINEFEKKLQDIRNLQSAIANYLKEGGSKRLMNLKAELEEKRQKKDNLERRKNEIEKELEKYKKFQNTHELQKRDLDTNLKMRTKNEELSKVVEEIKVLEGHVKVLNFDQLRRERSEKEKKKRELEQKRSNVEGKLEGIQSAIKDIQKELNNPPYKNSEDEYRKSKVKFAVVSKSVEDLKLYEVAMDWAMIHFHKERMKMINDIIREMWRDIYRGNDIDYIEVKTEESSSTASGRRNYNYKVIQVKSGIEIDMPGRCSAGQKVLACLIIRMALAETFCKNCGVLALDEPTTNLDHENIESLSEALAEIVVRRSAERKFQLIVITHDEEFLRRLFRVERVENYLEVKRDGRGRSQVILRSAFM